MYPQNTTCFQGLRFSSKCSLDNYPGKKKSPRSEKKLTCKCRTQGPRCNAVVRPPHHAIHLFISSPEILSMHALLRAEDAEREIRGRKTEGESVIDAAAASAALTLASPTPYSSSPTTIYLISRRAKIIVFNLAVSLSDAAAAALCKLY